MITRIWKYSNEEPPSFIDTFLTVKEAQTAIDTLTRLTEGKLSKTTKFVIEERND